MELEWPRKNHHSERDPQPMKKDPAPAKYLIAEIVAQDMVYENAQHIARHFTIARNSITSSVGAGHNIKSMG